EEVRLIPHIGPATRQTYTPSLPPQTQHSFSRMARRNLAPSIARNSGCPSTQATNQGTGYPFELTGRCLMRSGSGSNSGRVTKVSGISFSPLVVPCFLTVDF